jgi:hypothetical protein
MEIYILRYRCNTATGTTQPKAILSVCFYQSSHGASMMYQTVTFKRFKHDWGIPNLKHKNDSQDFSNLPFPSQNLRIRSSISFFFIMWNQICFFQILCKHIWYLLFSLIKIRIIKFIQYSSCSIMIKNSQDFHFWNLVYCHKALKVLPTLVFCTHKCLSYLWENNSNDKGISLYRVLWKSFICHFYMYDHSSCMVVPIIQFYPECDW